MLFTCTESDLDVPKSSAAFMEGCSLIQKRSWCLPEHMGFIKTSLKTYLLV